MSTPQTDGTATQDQAADARAARIRELMLDNLYAVFNQSDPERRLTAITTNYTEDVIWTDPEGTAQGHQAMNELGQKLLDRSPNFVFSAAGPVHVSGAWVFLRSTLESPSSHRRSAASTSRWCAMDGSPSCTRS